MKFWIDIETSAGAKVGDGPIITAQYFEYENPLNKCGTFRFEMPVTDARAALATAKRVARCRTVINGAVTDLGAGIIDKLKIDTERLTLEVSGDSLARELTHTTVGTLTIDDGAGGVDTGGPSDIIALAAGWSLDAVNGYLTSAKAVVHTFEGETILEALCKLAELTGERWRLGAGRTIVWMRNDEPDSGIRAVAQGEPVSLESNGTVCVISRPLTEEQDTYSAYVGRAYCYGTGNGATRLNLNGAAVAYAGYAIGNDAKGYYLEHAATWAAYGIERYVSFKDIADQDMLVEQAYEWMRRQLSAQKAYSLSVTKLDTTLTPGSTIRVVYKRVVDGYVGININTDLVILQTTNRVDTDGVRTCGLKVATIDRWPTSNDSGAIVGGLEESRNYQDYTQNFSGQVGIQDEGVAKGNATTLNFTGAGVTASVVGNLATINVPSGAAANSNVMLLHGATITEYAEDGTGVGLAAALAASAAGDTIWLPSGTIAGNHTIPAATTVQGRGVESVLSGTITVTGFAVNLTIGAVYYVYKSGSDVISVDGSHRVTVGAAVAEPNSQLTVEETFSVGESTAAGKDYVQLTKFGGPYVKLGRKSDVTDAPVRWIDSVGGVITGQWDLGLFSDGANRRMRLKSLTGAGVYYWTHGGDFSASGKIGAGIEAPAVQLHAYVENATTNAVDEIVRIAHNSNGAPAAGFGSAIDWYLESSTTTDQLAARIAVLWYESTHATRKGDLVGYAYDTAQREGWRVRGNGAAAAIGFYGVAPVARATTAGGAAAFTQNGGNAVNDASTIGGYTLLQVVQALQDIGILT